MTATVDLSTTDRAPATAGRMASAAQDFLASLTEQQRQVARLPFGDDRRYVWDYRPIESRPRNGLRLINMNEEQKRKALALLDIGLSTRGADTVRAFFGSSKPVTAKGKFGLARALAAQGDAPAAAQLVRSAWREDTCSASVEKAVMVALLRV